MNSWLVLPLEVLPGWPDPEPLSTVLVRRSRATAAATADAIARALSEAGFAASTRPVGAGVQICQHHCPVAHVAERFPELCEVETEAFARMLGVHVQRLATIAHGDGDIDLAGLATVAARRSGR